MHAPPKSTAPAAGAPIVVEAASGDRLPAALTPPPRIGMLAMRGETDIVRLPGGPAPRLADGLRDDAGSRASGSPV